MIVRDFPLAERWRHSPVARKRRPGLRARPHGSTPYISVSARRTFRDRPLFERTKRTGESSARRGDAYEPRNINTERRHGFSSYRGGFCRVVRLVLHRLTTPGGLSFVIQQSCTPIAGLLGYACPFSRSVCLRDDLAARLPRFPIDAHLSAFSSRQNPELLFVTSASCFSIIYGTPWRV